MDWRYWITYTGFVEADSEDRALVEAVFAHSERVAELPTYQPEVDVEPVEGREGE